MQVFIINSLITICQGYLTLLFRVICVLFNMLRTRSESFINETLGVCSVTKSKINVCYLVERECLP